MFVESLETRRFFAVTLQPGPTPQFVSVTQDTSGNVSIVAKAVAGGSKIAGGSKAGLMNVAVSEDHGNLVVTEFTTGATWTVDGATSVKITGSHGDDTILYTGNTLGANITGGSGSDAITVADTGTGSSTIDGGGGDDSINLLIAHNTHADGGGGNDTIYVNSGGGVYDVDNATAVVNGGGGNDVIVVYDGQASVAGGGGKDQVLVDSTDGASATVTKATVTTF